MSAPAGVTIDLKAAPASPVSTPASPGSVANTNEIEFVRSAIYRQFGESKLPYDVVLTVSEFHNYLCELGGRSRPGKFMMAHFCRDEVSATTVDLPAPAVVQPPPALGEHEDMTPNHRHHHHQYSAYVAKKKRYREDLFHHQSVTQSLMSGSEDGSVPVFSFNSLAGYCTCGTTAYGAAAHHTWDTGAFIELVGGPHIGLHFDAKTAAVWGKLYRQNVKPPLTDTCGAAAALESFKSPDPKNNTEMTRLAADFRAYLGDAPFPTGKPVELIKLVCELTRKQIDDSVVPGLVTALKHQKKWTVQCVPCVVVNVSFTDPNSGKSESAPPVMRYYSFVAVPKVLPHAITGGNTTDSAATATDK